MKKKYLLLVILLGGLFALILLAPKHNYPKFSGKIEKSNKSLSEIATYVAQKDLGIKNLKPNNSSYIVWADSIPKKTAYSVVYLHGFSASPMEGDPVHKEFAARYGCNLYVPLLTNHGIDTWESFRDLTPKDLIDSAKEAIAIGKQLGEKVIVLSCSTGATLSAYLAAENPDMIDAQITFSPNIELADKKSMVLTLPWGLQLARLVMGGNYFHADTPEFATPYWTKHYRLEGAIALQTLLNQTMTSKTFKKIKQPLFVGYYYKNEQEQDHVVSVPAMKRFFEEVSTPNDLKEIKAFAEGKHVLISELQNKHFDIARQATFDFAEKVLKLKKVK